MEDKRIVELLAEMLIRMDKTDARMEKLVNMLESHSIVLERILNMLEEQTVAVKENTSSLTTALLRP